MASFLGKECLSPLTSGSVRRRSLEICQQIGGQLLSPGNLLQQFGSTSPSQKEKSLLSPNLPQHQQFGSSSPSQKDKSGLSPNFLQQFGGSSPIQKEKSGLSPNLLQQFGSSSPSQKEKSVSVRWNLSLNPEEVLGKGSFGTVVAGQYQGKQVAVKVLKTTNAQKKASLLGEENALDLPFHNHVARTLDILQLGPDRTLIIMEKMQKGNLLTRLNDPSFQIDCSDAVNISKQIALALIFCHRHGILHLDVKPQNILVDHRNCYKLSDFGNSKKISDLSTSHYKYAKLEGTVPYTAPELFKGTRPTEKCDVYSFAITMWQIITRELPYENEHEHTVIFRVVSQGLRPGNNNNEPVQPDNPHKNNSLIKYVQLYQEAWDSDPEVRPSMIDIHKSLIKIQFSIG